MTIVPMSHPATVVKNSDGTYSVRVQHTPEGSVTNVDFTNVLFAETLATGYAAMLNGKAVLKSAATQLGSDVAPVLEDVNTEVENLLSAAKNEAQAVIKEATDFASKVKTEAKAEATDIKNKASAFFAEIRTNAEKTLEEAEVKAKNILNEARAEAAKLAQEAAAKLEPSPAPKKPVVEEDEA